MDGLRWLLLLFGLLVIAGVYYYSRRERNTGERTKRAAVPADRLEPSLDVASQDANDANAESEPEDQELDPDEPRRQQKIVTLRVVARDHGSFAGDALILGLRGIGLRHGKFGIFHQYDGENEKKVVFSAASLVEPGSFDLASIKDQAIPGISLFMVLPGPLDGAQAFDRMMTAGRELARALNAELLDESGSTLSVQRERYLREEVIQYQHGIKVA